MKLAYITTISMTQHAFLIGQNRFMQEQGFELHAIATPDEKWDGLIERDGVIPHALYISREITPLQDLVTLWKLFRLLRRIRPDLLHLSTPKAALLGSIAGWLARVPARVFLVRGSITENARGGKRVLFRTLEWLTNRLSHQTIAVSHSLRTFIEAEGITAPGQCIVVGRGMSNGIDVKRFDPQNVVPVDIRQLLSPSSPIEQPVVIGYLGRIAFDKGVTEIATAWQTLRDEFPEAVLLLCGPWEEENPVSPAIRQQLESDARVILTGRVSEAERYYAAMDIGLLPSHGTEGFPNAPMEAAAMEVPMIVTAVIGCVDAVVEGQTGRIIPVQDVPALTTAIRGYLESKQVRQEHGRKARQRVLDHFQRGHIWAGLYAVYHELLSRRLPASQLQELQLPVEFVPEQSMKLVSADCSPSP